MTQAFLSYSREDGRWAPLVKKLLEFHHVGTWLDTEDIAPGSDFKDALRVAIEATDILLVLAGSGSPRSKWITREIATFKAVKPAAPIIPLIFDDVDLSEVFADLESYQSISFLKDVSDGFEKLFKYLGVDFLEKQERRAADHDRRADNDRRATDRRLTKIDQRLRVGLWKEFHAKTGAGEYDEFGAMQSEDAPTRASARMEFGARRSFDFRSTGTADITGAIVRYARILAEDGSELSRYRILEKGTEVPVGMTFDLLHEIVHRVYRHQEAIGGRTANIYIVESVAFCLLEWFDISTDDRRSTDRRDAAKDRRRAPGK
jgi:hypothetical protein